MHELQRRQFVRIAFLLACVAPTLLVTGFAIRMRLPSYATSYAEAIARTTDTDVRIERVSHPKPHVTRLANLQVFALDNHNLLLQANNLDVVHTDMGFEIDGDLELHADAMTVWSIIQRQLRQRGQSRRRVTLRCDKLVWRNDWSSQTFCDVRCDLKSIANNEPTLDDKDSSFVCSFRDAETANEEAGTVAIQRTVLGGRSQAKLIARTNQHAIKPSLLFSSWQPYSGDSTVLGELQAICEADAWRGTAKNVQWRGLSGKNIIGERLLPLRLTGGFELTNASCEFADRRIDKVSGELTCQNGILYDALLRRLPEAGFKIAKAGQGPYELQESRFAFSVGVGGCRIHGLCDANGEATQPIAVGKRLRIEAPASAIRIDDLVSVWAPPTNQRALRFVENLRHRLPLDRLRISDRPVH